ncbi:MAG: hypothetical protein J6L70_01640 [Alphaproteobacteria bacterium]|nr:hypothetical protein [Alphaproteobacteria bacterium]
MKKLLTLTAVGALLAAPASAVQKCVALDSSTTTCTNIEAEAPYRGWKLTCTTNGITVPIEGTSSCSKTAALTLNTIKDDLKIKYSENDSSEVYCWCQMIRPLASSWVLAHRTFGMNVNCTTGCAEKCAETFSGNADFRSAMISTLSD